MRATSALCCIALASSLVLAAATAMAAGNYAFAPPADWARQRAGSTSAWIDTSRTQTVTLFPTEFGGDLGAFVNRTLNRERASYPGLHVWTNRTYALCGGHPGRYVIWTQTPTGKGTVWEQVIALWGYDAYIVSYKRPSNDPPDNAARASLLSVCGVGSVPMSPGGVPVTPVTQVNQPQAQAPQPASLPDAGAQQAPNPQATISHPYMPIAPP